MATNTQPETNACIWSTQLVLVPSTRSASHSGICTMLSLQPSRAYTGVSENCRPVSTDGVKADGVKASEGFDRGEI